MKSLVYWILIFTLSPVIPYLCISLVALDLNMSNWHLVGRIVLVLWTLAIMGAVHKKVKNKP